MPGTSAAPFTPSSTPSTVTARPRGFDLDASPPCESVIASSGAGGVAYFVALFAATDVEAALAADTFHRHELPIQSVKEPLAGHCIQAL